MNIIKNAIYGYIVGDVFGLSYLKTNKLVELKLTKNEELNIENGCYSSMTTYLLATLDSISTSNSINGLDILNKICTSLIVGKYTNNGKVYDIDSYTYNILNIYSKKNNINNIDTESDYTSYALSRILPLALYSYYKEENINDLIIITSLTNSNKIYLLGSYIYYKYLINILEYSDKYKSLNIDIPYYFNDYEKIFYKKILKNKIKEKDLIFDNNIVNILNVVFYIILNTNSFEEVLAKYNKLPGNPNIYLSLAGPIAGIIYGYESIPTNILKKIKNKREINKYISKFERIIK